MACHRLNSLAVLRFSFSTYFASALLHLALACELSRV